MTPDQIAAIKARAEKAREADKVISGAHISHIKGATSIEIAKAVVTLKAAAQQDIPDLLAALEASETARVKAEQERDVLKTKLRKAADALTPLADGVFNDNGDITVTIPTITYNDCETAYFVQREARRALESSK